MAFRRSAVRARYPPLPRPDVAMSYVGPFLTGRGLGRFQAADKGQMELYLRWLERYDQAAGEASPLGLILCAGKSPEHIELLRVDGSGIHVAEYLTELPPRDLLAARLHQAIQSARARLAGVASGDAEDAL